MRAALACPSGGELSRHGAGLVDRTLVLTDERQLVSAVVEADGHATAEPCTSLRVAAGIEQAEAEVEQEPDPPGLDEFLERRRLAIVVPL